MTIYYKVVEVWCKYPLQDFLDYRYCIFSYRKKPFKDLGFTMGSNTSIEEKEKFLKKKLGLKKIKVLKIK